MTAPGGAATRPVGVAGDKPVRWFHDFVLQGVFGTMTGDRLGIEHGWGPWSWFDPCNVPLGEATWPSD